MVKILKKCGNLSEEIWRDQNSPLVGIKRREFGEQISKENKHAKKITQRRKVTKAMLACPERIFRVECFALGPKQEDKKKTIFPPSLLKSRPPKKPKLPPIQPDLLKYPFPIPEDVLQSPLTENPTCFFPKAMEEELSVETEKTRERLKTLDDFVASL